MRTTNLLRAGASALALLLLAACGEAGDDARADGVATLSDDGGSADQAATDPDRAMLAFTRCMREHGVDMGDPLPPGEAEAADDVAVPQLDPGPAFTDAELRAHEEADAACRDLLADVEPEELDPEEQRRADDQALAHARCLREHGLDVPDPVAGGEAEEEPTYDVNAPETRAAEDACRHLVGDGDQGG
jgi:hypothetical protein